MPALPRFIPLALLACGLHLPVAVATSTSPTNSPLANKLQPAAANGTQVAVAFFVEEVCPQLVADGFGGVNRPEVGGTDGLRNRCSEIVRAGTGAVPNEVDNAQDGLQAMGAEEDSALHAAEVEVGGGHKSNVQDRISALRVSSITGGGAASSGLAAGEFGDGWGFFVSGLYGKSDKDTTSLETGFDLDAKGVTVGVDKRISDTTLLGGSIGFTDMDADLSGNSGGVETDGYTLQLYGTYATEAYFVDGIVGYTSHDHEQKRTLNYSISAFPAAPGKTTVVNQVASSSTDSDTFFVSLAVGRSYYTDSVAWGPYARFDYARTDIDAYSETMSAPAAAGSGLAVGIDKQDFTSTTLALGLQASTELKTGAGVVLYPQISIEYVHEFDNDNENITGRFVDDVTNTQFSLPTDSPDRNYGHLGVGLIGDFGGGTSAHVAYQGLIGYSGLSLHAFEVGLRVEF